MPMSMDHAPRMQPQSMPMHRMDSYGMDMGDQVERPEFPGWGSAGCIVSEHSRRFWSVNEFNQELPIIDVFILIPFQNRGYNLRIHVIMQYALQGIRWKFFSWVPSSGR